jgi:hypothetical protein
VAVKRQILIGGASRGLGLGLVRAFLEAGWQVHAVVRELRPASLLEALRTQYANDLQVITCDLNRLDAASAWTVRCSMPGSMAPPIRIRARPRSRISASCSWPTPSRQSAWLNSWPGMWSTAA